MKLSFSTNGWNGRSFPDFVSLAKSLGFSGLELHDVLHTGWTQEGGPFHPENAGRTSHLLFREGVRLTCLDSVCVLSDGARAAENEREIAACIRLAHDFSVPFVRVRAQDGSDAGLAAAAALVERALPAAVERDVTLLVETAGAFSDTAKLRDFLMRFSDDHLAALWDLHHPYFYGGEDPETTIRNLGAYVRHVHVKDSAPAPDGRAYCLVGEGELPLGDMIVALSSVNYDGYLSLEWNPAWMPELDDMEIVLTHFENHMRRFDTPKRSRPHHYKNRAGTGSYVWKKDALIDATFPRVLDRMAEDFPDQYAFKYTTLDYTRTYAEFRDDVDRCCRALISLGVGPGSHVAVWATNLPQWYIAFWAATKIGAVLVTVNTAYKIHEAEYLLRQSDTHTLVMIDHCLDSNYREIIQTLCPELADAKPGSALHCRKLPFLRNVITVGFRMPGCLTFDEAMDRANMVPREQILRMAAGVRPDDVCNMQYTSGTTGFPKGVMLTHYNVVNDGKCIGDRMDLSTADRMMIQVPMFHCFGMVLSMTSCMTHGATLCPMPYFSAKVSLACINQERITCFNGVPTMFIAMFNHPDYKKTDFSYMRTGIMAGSGCPPELMRRAAQPDEMHMTDIVSVYGQTESAPGSTMSACGDPLDLRCNTVGYAFPHIECKIIDPETGEEVPDGVNGEFCSRGYNTMKGYYKMPEATAATVDKEGWLHSGDLACRDENGCYRITGRLKDMIIRGGENIYPKEIEEFLYTHPKVSDVQVIGVPDEQYGEEIMACIILKEGETATEDEIRAFVRANMAKHKVPRYIAFTDAFPTNAAGKILKYKMREDAIEQLKLQKAAGVVTA